MNKLKRYIIFLIGLFVNSLGVSLITKANLGTSPISSIPYVLSLNFPLTLGNFTIIFRHNAKVRVDNGFFDDTEHTLIPRFDGDTASIRSG